ncbi:hypothetical protein ARMSODRAFT_1025156 [Armillaria solidipes]|uniref:Uncharacterized protein n=1 Tax=Armillaria solidipes TaxID=1076256 RepID=A0A2H3B4P6_9AGAR|nr:hypothetical protein ARMSODRAFT_1025156 [Armillaria solidipes]
MDASPSPLSLTTRTPISGGSMVAKDEEQACRVAHSQPMDYDWDGIDWSDFESFCTRILGLEESLPDRRSHSIQDPDCFIMDEELKISESPLPKFIELGPEWGCGATEPTASSDLSDEADILPETIPTNTVVKDEFLGATMNSKINDPDRFLSPSTPILQVQPSALYPTPPRSVSPPSAISLANISVSARQPTAIAGSSTWTSYSEASNVPSPLARNPYRALLFKDVETPSTWGASSKKNRQPQGGKVTRRNDNESRRMNPYPTTYMYSLPTKKVSNAEILNNPEFLNQIVERSIEKLAAGTHIYVAVGTEKVKKDIAPLYEFNFNFATAFFGLQRIAPPPDALHLCPYKTCLAALPIDDFPEHYDTEHSQWSYSACHKGSCPSFYQPHDPNGKHGSLCRRQIVCVHEKDRVFLTRENVIPHILEKHLKLDGIECPHCPAVLKQMETMTGHLKTCPKLKWARPDSKKNCSTAKGRKARR